VTTRREQVREAIARHRKRRERGFFWRPIIVTKDQLDQLEERGYLNSGDRGTRADECEAIASFLTGAYKTPGAILVWWLRSPRAGFDSLVTLILDPPDFLLRLL
jgi:hypothetical protein